MSITSNRPQPVYPCAQQDLYTIAETGWGSFTEHLPAFENHSTLYNAALAATQLAAVAAARALPDEYVREEVHKTYRLQLTGLAEACIKKWADMMSYVRDGFPEDEYENKRLAAGHGYYAGAERLDWDSVQSLMENGLAFANANTAALTTGGMPATFITAFEAAKVAFQAKHQEFLQAEELAKVQTDAKIEANNAIYRALLKMFEDGKKVFRDDAAVREQFVFDRVWELVSGSGGTDSGVPDDTVELGAYLYDVFSQLPVVGATLRVLNAPSGAIVEAVSGADGTLGLKIKGYAANATVFLDIEVFAAGYEYQFGQLEVQSGAFVSLDVPLTPSGPVGPEA